MISIDCLAESCNHKMRLSHPQNMGGTVMLSLIQSYQYSYSVDSSLILPTLFLSSPRHFYICRTNWLLMPLRGWLLCICLLSLKMKTLDAMWSLAIFSLIARLHRMRGRLCLLCKSSTSTFGPNPSGISGFPKGQNENQSKGGILLPMVPHLTGESRIWLIFLIHIIEETTTSPVSPLLRWGHTTHPWKGEGTLLTPQRVIWLIQPLVQAKMVSRKCHWTLLVWKCN